MFLGAAAFNQPIGGWDVSKVPDMATMFLGAAAFNQPIGGWGVSKVRSMTLHVPNRRRSTSRWAGT